MYTYKFIVGLHYLHTISVDFELRLIIESTYSGMGRFHVVAYCLSKQIRK